MTAKHTPGPWESNDYRVCGRLGKNERITVVCDTAHNQATRTEENRANARLIAAAPELLQSLYSFLAVMHKYGNWDDGCFYYMGTSASELQDSIISARSAIVKATE
jgi:hypothetical protein